MKYVIIIKCPCFEDIEVEAKNKKEAIQMAIDDFTCPGGSAEFCEILQEEKKVEKQLKKLLG